MGGYVKSQQRDFRTHHLKIKDPKLTNSHLIKEGGGGEQLRTGEEE